MRSFERSSIDVMGPRPRVKTVGRPADPPGVTAPTVGADRRLIDSAGLRGAIAAWQVVPWFRPVVDLDCGEVRSARVAMRWLHPDLGELEPASFAHLLVEPGLARAAAANTVRQAVWARRRLVPTVPAQFRLAVTVDGAIEDAVQLIIDGADTSRVDPAGVALAVSEATVLADPRAAEGLSLARSVGFAVWLDVPGGPCWPHLVDELPLDAVTLDGDADPAVLSLARRREVAVIARDVRSDVEGARFAAGGAHWGVGPHYGDARPLDDLERRLRVA